MTNETSTFEAYDNAWCDNMVVNYTMYFKGSFRGCRRFSAGDEFIMMY